MHGGCCPRIFLPPHQGPSLPTQLLGGSQFPLRVRMALALLPGEPPPPASEGQKDITLPVCDIISLSFKKKKKSKIDLFLLSDFLREANSGFITVPRSKHFRKVPSGSLSVAKQTPEVNCFFLWRPQHTDALGPHLPARLWTRGRFLWSLTLHRGVLRRFLRYLK